MNDKTIILLTGNDNFFGQTRKPWVSMDVERLQNAIQKQGYDVEKYWFHEIVNGKKTIKDSIVFYSFHQKLNRRDYIKDMVHFLNDGSNLLLPPVELLLCHENKGYQELYKKKIGLESLKAIYFSSIKELPFYDIKFPVVLKSVDTSNGKGVFLAHDQNELIHLIEKLEKQNPLVKLDLIRRKYFRKQKKHDYYPDYSNQTDYHHYRDYILKEKNFLLQEFIPNLNHDYRAMVFFDKYYVARRYAHEGDFRASGTKIHEYDLEVDPSLLNFTKRIYEKFDTPFLSIDVGQLNDDYGLFEFQGLHFGINLLIKSKGYYELEHGSWIFKSAKSIIEEEIALGLVKYLNHYFNRSGK
ncbi:hypothetical protein L0Z72_14300 [candidate division KSB1 bacterium]|nr:hypothetical protein [candidate division KSB1 bacterium]